MCVEVSPGEVDVGGGGEGEEDESDGEGGQGSSHSSPHPVILPPASGENISVWKVENIWIQS